MSIFDAQQWRWVWTLAIVGAMLAVTGLANRRRLKRRALAAEVEQHSRDIHRLADAPVSPELAPAPAVPDPPAAVRLAGTHRRGIVTIGDRRDWRSRQDGAWWHYRITGEYPVVAA